MKPRVLALFVLLLCAAQPVLCCEARSFKEQTVSPDLTVVVTHRKNPIAGIQVQVVPVGNAEPVFNGVTDERGTVLIRKLMVGRYWLSASHQGFEAGRELVDVVSAPNKKTRRRFEFEWADWSYQTRRVAGTLTGLVPGNTGNQLMDIVHPKKTVYPGVSITLRNAFSEEEYRTISDSRGAFVIEPVPQGTYVLTIEGGMKAISGTADVTRLVIDVVTDLAARDSLPLQLQDNGCYETEFALLEI